MFLEEKIMHMVSCLLLKRVKVTVLVFLLIHLPY